MDVISLIETENCEFWASSPIWSNVDSFQWYKNTQTIKERHLALKENFNKIFLC